MKKRVGLFVITAMLLLGLVSCGAEEAKPSVELGGTVEGLRVSLTDGAGTVETISPWKAADGKHYFFLPSMRTKPSVPAWRNCTKAHGAQSSTPLRSRQRAM